MQNSSDSRASNGRPIILYILIAIVLFAALILSVRWAKSRADFYGQQQTEQGQQVAEQESQPQGTSAPQEEEVATTDSSQSQPQTQSQPATTDTQDQGSAPNPPTVATTGPSPSHVPSTGPEEVLLPIASMSLFVFAVITYARTRRRLRDQALAQ